MNKFTKDVAEAIGCPEWTGTGCDNKHLTYGKGECYCLTAAANVLRHVADALGTDKTGEALVEVARNAHRAEQKLAAIERKHEHDWQPTDNWLIDRCTTCGEERA